MNERGGADPTVLVVEDYEGSSLVMSMLLKRYGCRVVKARDGEEALTVAGRERPDLILMDLCMSRLDGLDAARRIRADHALGKVPIIAISALAPEVYEPAALEAGCNEFISKPLVLNQLKDLLDLYLGKR